MNVRITRKCFMALVFITSFAIAKNSPTTSWPNAEQLKSIQEATDNYPLLEKLYEPERYFIDDENGLQLKNEIINEPKTYNQTTFNGPVNLFKTQFKKPVLFVLCQFNKPLVFSELTSSVFINFEWAIFIAPASFSYCQFENDANFYQAVFRDKATFYGSRFYNANFSDANFNADTIFSNVYFLNRTQFFETIFLKQAAFNGSYFYGDTNFTHAIFKQDVSFTQARFNRSVDFSHSEFNGKVDFNHTRFPPKINFSYVRNLKHPINFNNKDNIVTQPIQINLVGSDIPNIILDYNQYQLFFPEDTPENDKVDVYENLLQVQKDLGFMDGYKKLSIEFQTYQYNQKNQYIRYFLEKNMWNFGFDPLNLLLFVLYIIIFFTLINTFFYKRLVHDLYSFPLLDVPPPNRLIQKNRVLRYLFYLPLALVYTLLMLLGGIIGIKGQLHGAKRKSIFFGFYVVLMITTGAVCTFIILKYIFK